MTEELSGTAAVVTGGTSGIGQATSVAMARLGAHVALSGRDQERGNEVVRQIAAVGGRAEFLAADLGDEASARSLAERDINRLGEVDVLVNNAGVFPFGPTDETSEPDFHSVFALNVKVPASSLRGWRP
jgi:NAD(P)-dependent dehydrogenase (short-subunit alcohol dehydrogenase family)